MHSFAPIVDPRALDEGAQLTRLKKADYELMCRMRSRLAQADEEEELMKQRHPHSMKRCGILTLICSVFLVAMIARVFFGNVRCFPGDVLDDLLCLKDQSCVSFEDSDSRRLVHPAVREIR